MADREKVIKGLTECIHLYEYPDDWDVTGCVVCPYRPKGKGVCDTTIPIRLLKDALELLKEQEPVKPITTGKGILERTRCGACGSEIAKSHFYCWYCGRKVKWDALGEPPER